MISTDRRTERKAEDKFFSPPHPSCLPLLPSFYLPSSTLTEHTNTHTCTQLLQEAIKLLLRRQSAPAHWVAAPVMRSCLRRLPPLTPNHPPLPLPHSPPPNPFPTVCVCVCVCVCLCVSHREYKVHLKGLFVANNVYTTILSTQMNIQIFGKIKVCVFLKVFFLHMNVARRACICVCVCLRRGSSGK